MMIADLTCHMQDAHQTEALHLFTPLESPAGNITTEMTHICIQMLLYNNTHDDN